MSELVIEATNLSKIYRLYAKPAYRFMDMFGLLKKGVGGYTEHQALADVTLKIEAGEKVAFIGRNGAGKSTLLKVLMGVIEPTSGVVKVKSRMQALLQIGTGFHPDFTGRENVITYLSQLGIAGAEAAVKVEEIIEFAELEEYIDQPVKTYSTGMAVRLMFSTSTAIAPDILVLDEVLSVGDAYFSKKSFERIKEMSSSHGTTLLLVSHDIYSASSICDRMIWIDRGQVIMDSDSVTTIKAYESSIREQEEQRIRLRNLKKLQDTVSTPIDRSSYALLEIRSKDNKPLNAPIYFHKVALLKNGQEIFEGLGGLSKLADSGFAIPNDSWEEAATWQGKPARAARNYGSSYHKASVPLPVPALADDSELAIELEFWAEEESAVELVLFTAEKEFFLGALSIKERQWCTESFSVGSSDLPYTRSLILKKKQVSREGSALIDAFAVNVYDESMKESYVLEHGKDIYFKIHYRINKPSFKDTAQVLIAFLKNGAQDVARYFSKDLLFDAELLKAGVISLKIPNLPLAPGSYMISIMIANSDYYDVPQELFYSINPNVYTCLSRVVELKIEGNNTPLTDGTVYVGKGEWAIERPGGWGETAGARNG